MYNHKRAYVSIEWMQHMNKYMICTKNWNDNRILDSMHFAQTRHRAIIIANKLLQEWLQEDIILVYGIQEDVGSKVYTKRNKNHIIK